VTIPSGLQRATAAKDILEWQFQFHIWVWHSDEHDATGKVTCVEGLLIGLWVTNGFNYKICAETIGVLTNGFHGILVFGVDRVGSAKGLGLFQFGVVNIDGDDRGSSSQLSALDGGHADTTTTDHSHGFTALEFTGVNGCTNAGYNAAAQEANRSVLVVFELGVNLGALSSGDQGFFGERADTQCGFQFGAVFQGHLLFCVMGIKAILQLAFFTGTAFATYGAPVQDHLVTDFYVGDAFADFRYDGSGLMAEQVRVVIAHATFNIGIVRVANTAGGNIHNHFTWTRIWHDDRFDGYRGVLRPHNSGLDFMRHGAWFSFKVIGLPTGSVGSQTLFDHSLSAIDHGWQHAGILELCVDAT